MKDTVGDGTLTVHFIARTLNLAGRSERPTHTHIYTNNDALCALTLLMLKQSPSYLAIMCCPDATVPEKTNYKSGYRPQWAIFVHLGCNDEMSSTVLKVCFGNELLTTKAHR